MSQRDKAVPRWRLYAAKALVVLVVMAMMSAAVFMTGAAALYLAAWIKPSLAPTGHFDTFRYVGILVRMYLSSMLLIAVQLWVALRYASFVPALAMDIGGTFLAVVATSAKIGVVLPWQIPVNMLASDPIRSDLALLVGFAGGITALVIMLIDLSRREVY